jgi:hypothetical protein
MKLFLSLIAAAVVMTAGVPSIAAAAPCKDAKGKFTKCPPVAVKTTTTRTTSTNTATATSTSVKKDKNGRCHDAKGRFTKCP